MHQITIGERVMMALGIDAAFIS